jgi:streptogramin lyase
MTPASSGSSSLAALAALALAGAALAGAAPRGRVVDLAGAEAVAAGAGSVWATGPREVVRIEPDRGTIVARVALPALAGSLVVAGRLVWVVTNPPHASRSTGFAPALLYSIDTTTNRVVGKPIRLAPMAQGRIVAAAGSLWVTNDQHGRFGRLYRVDPLTRRLVQRIPVANDPSSVVLAAGSLWVGASDTGKVIRVDPTSGKVEGPAIAVGGALLTLAADGGRVWAADSYSDRLVRPRWR